MVSLAEGHQSKKHIPGLSFGHHQVRLILQKKKWISNKIFTVTTKGTPH